MYLFPDDSPNNLRITVDYRRQNSITIPNGYPLPHLHDTPKNLRGSVFFSKIDLKRTYHQSPMSEQGIVKTDTTTPFGSYEYTIMPLGLRNALATFQRYINSIFGHLDYCFRYS